MRGSSCTAVPIQRMPLTAAKPSANGAGVEALAGGLAKLTVVSLHSVVGGPECGARGRDHRTWHLHAQRIESPGASVSPNAPDGASYFSAAQFIGWLTAGASAGAGRARRAVPLRTDITDCVLCAWILAAEARPAMNHRSTG